ncbi:Laccase-2 [Diplodia seriata]|uniref:Laccase-2 n=1 Tax=Diplodia seriata TaxID=420778 RepID=A0A1S8BGD3_9PEZI|nr:Laccase-2 [Diplodia seriata]
MGFFKNCWELLLHLPYFSPLNGGFDRDSSQLPLASSPSGGVVIRPENASPGFTCSYPSMDGWESCNSPDDRSCWLKDSKARQPYFSQYDIHTDYETIWPKGVTREIFPDGYSKPYGKIINDTYPGPLIEACWGDEVVVHVTNYLQTNGSTIHWHGVRQQYSNEMDGVNGVTQCPIAYGDTFTYRFRVTQYGTTWYHSHYSLQYPDGVAGPLVFHGPTSADWDEEWETPLMMTDWVHDSAFGIFPTKELRGVIPNGDSILLNGHGHFNCSLDPLNDPSRCAPGHGSYYNRTFQKGKKYLIRLINTSVGAAFIFSIDGHKMKVISTDFVPIEPYETNAVLLNIGQRYNIIIEANADPGDYWIRTEIPRGPGGCGNVTDRNGDVTGILRYDASSTALPTSSKNEYESDCHDEPKELLVPILPWMVDPHPQNDVHNNTYEAGITEVQYHNAFRWDLTDTPMWLDFSNPTILNLENTTWNPEYAVIDCSYPVLYP